MSTIDICGVLVSARPERAPQVRKRLKRMPGVEVHAVSDAGRMVVTVEGSPGHNPVDTIGRLVDVSGVLATALVFQYSDHEETDQESAT